MIEVTPYQLLRALLQATPDLHDIEIRMVNSIKNELENRYYNVDFSHMAFKRVADAYPQYIKLQASHIVITQSRVFAAHIEQRARFIINDEIDNQIKEIWMKKES